MKKIGGIQLNSRKLEFPFIYINGNYQVHIREDGTKIRVSVNDEDFFPTRPETIDVNISNYCEHNCPFCYIDAGTDKPHGNLNMKLFDNIKPGTELAINYAKHPGLLDFLYRMEKQRVIVNMTVNQKDLEDSGSRMMFQLLLDTKLITGLGVSVNSVQTLRRLDSDNIVYHVIVGITPITAIEELIRRKGKILFLGYKTKGRGSSITPSRMDAYRENISRLMTLNESIFSFDNLALEQLGIEKLVSEETWLRNYMGDEGQFSMYLDTVQEKYYRSSTEEIGYMVVGEDISKLFNNIRNMIRKS